MSLIVEHLCFSYDDRDVLQDVSFSAEYGEVLSILGPNGVGKSTLFRCMLGLLTAPKGSITINGQSISSMQSRQLAQHIAYIPQSDSPAFSYSVLDMVLMGTTAQLGRFGSPRQKQHLLAEQALDHLGILHLKDRSYIRISGGERQLVLIARALAQQAKLLIMDEPSANLDFGNRLRVMHTIRDLAGDGYAIIQSTHDPDQAYQYSDRILALHDGKVLAFGSPKETITAPVISTLYGVDADVCSMKNDRVRICIEKDAHETERKSPI